MQEFEEASIGGQPQGAPTAPQDQAFQVTTNDLVFMIGEKAIGERQSNKLIAVLQQNLNYLQQELMKLQSVGAASTGELEALRQKAELAEQRANAADAARAAAEQAAVSQGASWQSRIVSLEQQVFQTAQERDAAINKRDELLPGYEASKISIGQLQGDVARITQERDEAIRERDAAKQELIAVERTISGMEADVATLRQDLDSLKAAAQAPAGWEEATAIPDKPVKRAKK